MDLDVMKIDCPHRDTGEGAPVIEGVVTTSDGMRHPAGSVCAVCAAEWSMDQLRAWASWPISWALSGQPWLGAVEVGIEVAPGALTAERRHLLALHLEADKMQLARSQTSIVERAGMESLAAEERARRVVLRVGDRRQ